MSTPIETPTPPAVRPLLTLLAKKKEDEVALRPVVEALLVALQEGRHCIPIEELSKDATSPSEEDLRRLECVGRPGEFKPFIIEDGLLYLHRYWNYEVQVAHRLQELSPPIEQAAPSDLVDRLFTGADTERSRAQRRAVEASITARLLVISGGPGTGKTTVAARIVALRCNSGRPLPGVVLTAPTGKAAARLKEATINGLTSLAREGRLDLSPEEIAELCSNACTVHRLLGPRNGSIDFWHNRSNPLPQDIVIVDEVSMMDLPLMAKLLDAIDPTHSQLILLGDADQLPSVQAGNVMADIIEGGAGEAACLSRNCHRLSYNFRAQENPELTRLIDDCKTGNAPAVLEQLSGASSTLLRLDSPGRGKLPELLEPMIARHFLPLTEIRDPLAAFDCLDGFRILCAMRRGPYGIQFINDLVAHRVHPQGMIIGARRPYHGLPIIITVNDYGARLFNGDTGIILRDHTGNLAAYFPDEKEPGAFRHISIARLPAWEPAYALTVHRSQGSQFRDVLFLMPDQDSPLLTRQLFYTAVSRASHSVTVVGRVELIREALARGAGRSSGLARRLGQSLRTSPN